MHFDEDFALAAHLQNQFLDGLNVNDLKLTSVINSHTYKAQDVKNKYNDSKKKSHKEASIVDSSWEYIDPTPDVHALFIQFDNRFFWGKLRSVEVRWSRRMTSCAGVCCYEGRGGLCSVRLSFPLLKLRPRKDLVETLLHEMIHAYLFVTCNNRDREGHGPEFHKQMYRINKEAGTNITVYHSFHEEVKLYKQHWWRCDGPCQNRPPFFGMVKRAMNRPPGPTDLWWEEHQAKCGGRHVKIREPPGFSEKKAKQAGKKVVSASTGSKVDIRNFFPSHGNRRILGNTTNNGSVTNKTLSKTKDKPQSSLLSSSTNNITGFKDLFDKNMSGGQSHDRLRTNDSVVANKQNGGLLPRGSPNNVPFDDKAHSTFSSKCKDSVRTSTSGGMLANKGGGTLVITAQGRNKGASYGNLNSGKKVINNIVPFTGKGYTLNAGSETHGKSATFMPNLMKNFVLSEDSGNGLGNRTLLTGVTANKRNGSAIKDEGSKKIKGASLLGVTSKSDTDDNAVQCPVCNSEVRELDVNTHLDSCLGACVFDDGASAVQECCVKSVGDSREVKCPACNSGVLKSDLNDHLDMCLGSVFGNASVDDDGGDWDDKNVVDGKPGCDMCPCPCCASLVKYDEMNTHLDHCLIVALE